MSKLKFIQISFVEKNKLKSWKSSKKTQWELCQYYSSPTTGSKPHPFRSVLTNGRAFQGTPPPAIDWFAAQIWGCCPIRAALRLTKVSSGDQLMLHELFWGQFTEQIQHFNEVNAEKQSVYVQFTWWMTFSLTHWYRFHPTFKLKITN